jgi:GNAT superfamily N-acetyltransferase
VGASGYPTLWDGLMLVLPECRRRGLGRVLVRHFEDTAGRNWKLSVVFNTDLLEADCEKPPATRFWVACGYTVVADTGGTRLLTKTFERPPSGDH